MPDARERDPKVVNAVVKRIIINFDGQFLKETEKCPANTDICDKSCVHQWPMFDPISLLTALFIAFQSDFRLKLKRQRLLWDFLSLLSFFLSYFHNSQP